MNFIDRIMDICTRTLAANPHHINMTILPQELVDAVARALYFYYADIHKYYIIPGHPTLQIPIFDMKFSRLSFNADLDLIRDRHGQLNIIKDVATIYDAANIPVDDSFADTCTFIRPRFSDKSVLINALGVSTLNKCRNVIIGEVYLGH